MLINCTSIFRIELNKKCHDYVENKVFIMCVHWIDFGHWFERAKIPADFFFFATFNPPRKIPFRPTNFGLEHVEWCNTSMSRLQCSIFFFHSVFFFFCFNQRKMVLHIRDTTYVSIFLLVFRVGIDRILAFFCALLFDQRIECGI